MSVSDRLLGSLLANITVLEHLELVADEQCPWISW